MGDALMIFTLRDLAEGDVRLGFGAAKGFGSLTATYQLNQMPKWDSIPQFLQDELKSIGSEIEHFIWPGPLSEELKLELMVWIENLAKLSAQAAKKQKQLGDGRTAQQDIY
ncbi:MAG: hypothetical protein IPM55_18865 [Acidobacteria bacterium]|nr:hypothetical protein [Acidobacteriota bacterium]